MRRPLALATIIALAGGIALALPAEAKTAAPAATPVAKAPKPGPGPKGTAWVPVLFGGDAGEVAAVDLGSGAVTHIDTDVTYPYATALSPDGTKVYATELFSSDVVVISTVTKAVTGRITAGGQPNGVAFSPDGTRAYVTNTTDNTVTVIDATTDSLVTTVTGFAHPLGVAVSANGARAYVANYDDGTLAVLDTTTYAVTSSPAGTNPTGVAVGYRGRVFVANSGSSDVTVHDGVSGAQIAGSPIALPAGATPEGIAAKGGDVWVSNVGPGGAQEIDARRLRLEEAYAIDGVWGIAPASGPFLVVVQPGAPSALQVIRENGGASVRTVELGTLALGLGNFVGR